MTKLEINPSIDRAKLAKLFGGGNASALSGCISLKIERMMRIFRTRLKPQLYYRKVNIDAVDCGSVQLGEGPVLRSGKLSKAMMDCESMVSFIATIGPGVEEEVKRQMHENRLAVAYILDSMGSVAVENIVERFCKGMQTKYRARNKGVTLRFSPGYCDWPIVDQKKLFSLFDSSQLIVQLMDSCLMQPRKSISGVFGLMPFNRVPSGGPHNPCHECKKRDCMARRR